MLRLHSRLVFLGISKQLIRNSSTFSRQILKHPSMMQFQFPQFQRNFTSEALGKIEPSKFNIQLTCKKCNTRNSYIISKNAYEKGVVIVECQGCKSNHLIADNMKFFRDEKTNIEDILREKGEIVQKGTINQSQLEDLIKDEIQK